MKRSAGDLPEEEGDRRNVRYRSDEAKNDCEMPIGEIMRSQQALRPEERNATGRGSEAERLDLLLRASGGLPQSGTVPQSFGEALRLLSPAVAAPTVGQNGIDALLRLQLQQQMLANQQHSQLSQLMNLRQRQEIDNASLSSLLPVQDRHIGSLAPAPISGAALSFEQQLLALQRHRNLQVAPHHALLGLSQLPGRGLSFLLPFANLILLGASPVPMGSLPSRYGSLAPHLQQVSRGLTRLHSGHSPSVPVSHITSTSMPGQEPASIDHRPTNANASVSEAMGQSTADSSISDATTTSRKSLQKVARHKQGDVSEKAVSEDASDQTPTKRKKRPYHHESFPVKLHRLIREAEAGDKTHIISFNDEGTDFHVHTPAAFEEEILHNYFRHNKLSSFRRLLNMYGFVRLQDGAEGGTFRHPSFLKDKPELCQDLQRVR